MARRSDIPTPGFYLVRLTRGGPWVGASIVHDPETGWTVMQDGETQGPAHDPWTLPNMERVHYWGRDTTEAEVAFRIAMKLWAEEWKPDAPAANPRRKIDLDEIIPF